MSTYAATMYCGSCGRVRNIGNAAGTYACVCGSTWVQSWLPTPAFTITTRHNEGAAVRVVGVRP